jgi:hypothetical protein
VALKSDAAAEKPKDQLSRDFLGCSIFDFCNKICQQETYAAQQLPAFRAGQECCKCAERIWKSINPPQNWLGKNARLESIHEKPVENTTARLSF